VVTAAAFLLALLLAGFFTGAAAGYVIARVLAPFLGWEPESWLRQRRKVAEWARGVVRWFR